MNCSLNHSMKNSFYLFFLVIAIFLLSNCSNNEKTKGSEHTDSLVNNRKDSSITTKELIPVVADGITYEIKTFGNEPPLNGFGYDIFLNQKVYVHQPNIPAVQGNNGFSSEESARKTALFVLFKIKNHIMPPSVEVRELDSIGALR